MIKAAESGIIKVKKLRKGDEFMGQYLNVGNAGFTNIRNGLYVDKTGLISFINSTLETMSKLTCVSRPRRFGKSYAAKMLCAYYDSDCDSRKLFEGLAIESDPLFEKHLNKHNVIYLDMTWFISGADNIKDTVKNLQSEVIEDLHKAYPNVKKEKSLQQMLYSISQSKEEKIKFIIIIDEWDALFREAKNDKDLQKEYIQLLRSLFRSNLTDDMIEAAYITGILPMKKYGTQSAMTDFKEYTMTAPKRLAEYVGFTEDEVRKLCDEYNMNFNEMKYWYDGYSFSKIESVYSPNSVISAIENEDFGTYWTETETYESLKIYIDMDKDGLKEAILQMLGGESFRIDTKTFQNDLVNINQKDDVLTLLVHLGYLAYNEKKRSVYIPNEEIRQEFVRSLENGNRKEIIKIIRNSDELLEDTLSMDSEAVAAALEEAHNSGVTPLFYNNEQALRSVIRLAYISCEDGYIRFEEFPSGKGYADIAFIPINKPNKSIILIELKWNKTAKSAIEQIKNKNYPKKFEKLENDILLVGINYNEKTQQHTCKIELHKR